MLKRRFEKIQGYCDEQRMGRPLGKASGTLGGTSRASKKAINRRQLQHWQNLTEPLLSQMSFKLYPPNPIKTHASTRRRTRTGKQLDKDDTCTDDMQTSRRMAPQLTDQAPMPGHQFQAIARSPHHKPIIFWCCP